MDFSSLIKVWMHGIVRRAQKESLGERSMNNEPRRNESEWRTSDLEVACVISDREFPLQRLNAPDVAVDVFFEGTTMRGRKHRTKKRSWKTNRCGSRYSPDKNLALFQRYESLRDYQNSKSESQTVESSRKFAADPPCSWRIPTVRLDCSLVSRFSKANFSDRTYIFSDFER